MTTLKQQIASDVSAVFLDTDEFAETWTQWPRGVEANAASVVVVPDLPMAERKTHRGEEQIQKPEIWVADSVTVPFCVDSRVRPTSITVPSKVSMVRS